MKLSELKTGQSAIIEGFSDDELSLRFLEMGCVPGEKIELERIAPLGDPIAIRVSGYSLCLRFSEAESIVISPLPALPNRMPPSALAVAPGEGNSPNGLKNVLNE